MTLYVAKVMSAIGYTEASTFNEFLTALGDDCPSKGDTSAWATLFNVLDQLAQDGEIEIEKSRGRIDALQLTEAGAARVRDEADKARPLFN